MGLVILIIWVVMCGAVAWVATQRGRSTWGFFFLAFCLSPLVAYAVLVALQDLLAVERAERHAERMTADIVAALSPRA